jgi:hypothetical protein
MAGFRTTQTMLSIPAGSMSRDVAAIAEVDGILAEKYFHLVGMPYHV